MSSSLKVQDLFIENLIQAKQKVSIYLVNGIKLQGVITRTDEYTLVLDNVAEQLVFKHAISTIVPVGASLKA